MDGGTNATQVVDPASEERWRLSRRADLANVFGMMLTVPWHGQDDQGNWRYGLRPYGGFSNDTLQTQFESDMQALIQRAATELTSRGLLTQEELDSLSAHPYSVGPMAQEWPKIFFDLYRDAQPFLADGASILGWGYFFRDAIKAVTSWASEKTREESEQPLGDAIARSGYAVMPEIALTRPAIVALCYSDLVNSHAITEELTIDTFPRSYTEYETVDHPGGGESYLIRARAGRRSFVYHITGQGKVVEHYLIVGSTLTLLPLPNLTEEDTTYQPRQPLPSQRVKIRAR